MIKFGVFIFLVLATNLLTVESIFIRLYNRNGSFIDEDITNAAQLVPRMDMNEKVTIYIHGYQGNISNIGVQIITNAYLENTNHNILAIDYESIANWIYPISTVLLSRVGNAVAKAVNDMMDAGISPQKIHLIGFSLGSHVAGFAGRNTKVKISRITGLDPAGPMFYFIISALKTSDAEFVDVIHTDRLLLGSATTKGNANFFPNFGYRRQPNCRQNGVVTDVCSHVMSYKYYAESVKNPNAFIGLKCSSTLKYISGACNNNEEVVMGFATPTNASGKYYLTTNLKSPYGRGRNGIMRSE
ncbi:pancreatic triacylglycerol lipase [Xylocopa sonorina]|uniref:pancreatic triacylglycerol lipase n=1 Tax=Xylocopa sonorina TaxID=1818115 RepID=UPI00403A8CCB